MTAAPLRLDHVTLAVTSLERSGPYYDVLLPLLGFRKESELIWTDGQGFFFQFLEARPDTRPYERYGAGMNHLGFGAPDPDFVHRVRDAMAKAGFDVPEIQNLRGATALFMKDPDGVRFEITHYPPGTPVVG
jgi:catechol 2,3-dioxygenase-like lactoylglutathione lyase family enzyme